MTNVIQIPQLPAASALNGSEQLEAVQAGVSVRLTIAQIQGSLPFVTQTIVAAPIAGGAVTFNLTIGAVFTTTIDADITSFNIIGGSPDSANSFLWVPMGNGVSFSQSYGSVLWPSGASPVLTRTAGKRDVLAFLQVTDWLGFVSGQNF